MLHRRRQEFILSYTLSGIGIKGIKHILPIYQIQYSEACVRQFKHRYSNGMFTSLIQMP